MGREGGHREETAETQTEDKTQTLKTEAKDDADKTEEQGNKEIGHKGEQG